MYARSCPWDFCLNDVRKQIVFRTKRIIFPRNVYYLVFDETTRSPRVRQNKKYARLAFTRLFRTRDTSAVRENFFTPRFDEPLYIRTAVGTESKLNLFDHYTSYTRWTVRRVYGSASNSIFRLGTHYAHILFCLPYGVTGYPIKTGAHRNRCSNIRRSRWCRTLFIELFTNTKLNDKNDNLDRIYNNNTRTTMSTLEHRKA